MTNEQYEAYVRARARGKNPDDEHSGSTIQAVVDAVLTLQQKALQLHEQIRQLQADVERLQAENHHA